jgi:hypothetical protein
MGAGEVARGGGDGEEGEGEELAHFSEIGLESAENELED